MIDRIHPETMFNTAPMGFAPVVVHDGLVFVSGQLGAVTGAHGIAEFRAQVAAAFDSLHAGLLAGGATPETVLKITALVVDHDAEKLAVVSEARRRFFAGHPPASTLIPVPKLAGAGLLFEIDAVAVRA